VFKQPNVSNATIYKLADGFLSVANLTASEQDQTRNVVDCIPDGPDKFEVVTSVSVFVIDFDEVGGKISDNLADTLVTNSQCRPVKQKPAQP